MAGDDFFKTRMGHRFYEATMPKISDQLERLNTNLEALVAELRRQREAREGATPASTTAVPAADATSPLISSAPMAAEPAQHEPRC